MRTDSEPAGISIAAVTNPAPAERDEVIALVRLAAEVDGRSAVNEAGMLALRHPGDPDDGAAAGHGPATHLLARQAEAGDRTLIGYAQTIWETGGPVAALVVHPEHRRRGIGSALWRSLAADSEAPLRVWAGDGPAARALAARQGLRPVRTLLRLARPLDETLPPVMPPEGVTIRAFQPGRDEQPWLRANARAFADHPEQGSLTLRDLKQRMAEPWFDPAGFLVATRDQRLIGFHWTKLPPGSATGEVYVIGVDPAAGVRGLGTPLLGMGLAHLRDSGASTVELYVEADNERALALYHRHGFATASADVMYAQAEGRGDERG